MWYPRRFYVGAQHLAQDPDHIMLHESAASAITQAQQKCQDSGDPQIVVEIIATVRPASTPTMTVDLRKPTRKRRAKK